MADIIAGIVFLLLISGAAHGTVKQLKQGGCAGCSGCSGKNPNQCPNQEEK